MSNPRVAKQCVGVLYIILKKIVKHFRRGEREGFFQGGFHDWIYSSIHSSLGPREKSRRDDIRATMYNPPIVADVAGCA